jgi:hypothetical protein
MPPGAAMDDVDLNLPDELEDLDDDSWEDDDSDESELPDAFGPDLDDLDEIIQDEMLDEEEEDEGLPPDSSLDFDLDEDSLHDQDH